MQKLTKQKNIIKMIVIPVSILVLFLVAIASFHIFAGHALNTAINENLGADEKTVKEKIDIEQFIEKDKSGKYKQLSKKDVEALVGETEYETEVHVYESKEGVGYQIIYTDYVEYAATSTNEGYTQTITKAIGYGPLKDYLTHDWK